SSQSSPARTATLPADDWLDWPDLIDAWLGAWAARLPAEADIRRAAAIEDYRRGRYQQAATALDRLLTRNPDDIDLLIAAAAAQCKLGQYEDALPLLRRALELDPARTPARYQYAVALVRLDRRAEAATAFEKLLEASPGHRPARFALAILLQADGRLPEALAQWRKTTAGLSSAPPATQPTPAVAPPPGDLAAPAVAEAFFHRGETALALDQYAEAEECFQTVVARRPDDARAWCNLGIARAALEREPEAISALHEALRRKPDLVPAINQLAFVYARRYRSTRDPADQERLVDLCQRSLAVRSHQPDIAALRNAAIEAGWTTSREMSR
ncbi:MAG: tetratricopeptide repeat protein, partial [Phycisphaerae bacterium]